MRVCQFIANFIFSILNPANTSDANAWSVGYTLKSGKVDARFCDLVSGTLGDFRGPASVAVPLLFAFCTDFSTINCLLGAWRHNALFHLNCSPRNRRDCINSSPAWKRSAGRPFKFPRCAQHKLELWIASVELNAAIGNLQAAAAHPVACRQ